MNHIYAFALLLLAMIPASKDQRLLEIRKDDLTDNQQIINPEQ